MENRKTLEQRIDRIIQDLDEVLRNEPVSSSLKKNDNKILLGRLGLTHKEAKAWLKQEPNYRPADEKKQPFRTDDKGTEPHKHIYIVYNNISELSLGYLSLMATRSDATCPRAKP
jgi:hypothetical protein